MPAEFIFPVRVYIEDTDFGGLVYHANHLKYFERARSEWAELAGLGMEWQQQKGVYFVVRSASLEYLKPIRLNDSIEVVSRYAKIGRTSIEYDQILRPKEKNDVILCKAMVKIVCVNKQLQPCLLPSEIVKIGELL